MISVSAVRVITLVICVAGIVGMIVTSVLDHNGAAITFGLITAVAILCSMVAKAVAADIERNHSATGTAAAPADDLAALVESHVSAIVAEGASEPAVRQLVGEAVRLGRALGPGSPGSRPVGWRHPD